MLTISETADTFSYGVVEPLDLKKVSRLYVDKLEEISEDVLRFNFPHDYSIRLGSLYSGRMFLHKENDELIFCMTQLPILNQITLRPYLYKRKGDPVSIILDADEDCQFFLVPKYFSPFKEGDEIEFEYVPEDEPDTERKVICRIK